MFDGCQDHNTEEDGLLQDKLASSPGHTFKVVKDLLSRQSQVLPSANSNKTVVNQFATFFHQKVAKLRSALDSAGATLPPDTTDETAHTWSAELAQFSETSADSLRKLIMQAPTKSCMLDPLPTWLLKDPCIMGAVLTVLRAAINACLVTGAVPSCMKRAVVYPLLKKPSLDPNELKHYRLISNLLLIGTSRRS